MHTSKSEFEATIDWVVSGYETVRLEFPVREGRAEFLFQIDGLATVSAVILEPESCSGMVDLVSVQYGGGTTEQGFTCEVQGGFSFIEVGILAESKGTLSLNW